jgi:aquaporin Z
MSWSVATTPSYMVHHHVRHDVWSAGKPREQSVERQPMFEALRKHWPEYLMETAELGMFMISACVFAILIEHPASPIPEALPHPNARRLLMGIAMGLTAVGILYSPWGQQSGGHLNPAVTLTFLRLGKVKPWDAVFYIGAQFLGGIAGVFMATAFLREAVAHPAVNYVATRPGDAGAFIAFAAEFGISFILMSVVLRASNTAWLARYTPMFAGMLVATYITLEAPISGMSMNPARTFGSALAAQSWTSLWVYFTAPPLGMLLAAEVYRGQKGAHAVICAKLHHHNDKRCIFHCGYQAAQKSSPQHNGSPVRA